MILQTCLGWHSGLGATLLVGQSRDRLRGVWLGFSVTYSFRPYHGPGGDSAPSENEYQEHFLVVKAAGAWGWQPYHLHVPNVMKISEPEPPGNLWATPGLLRDSPTFYYTQTIKDTWEVTLHWWVSGFGCFETSGITHSATQLHIPESLNPRQQLARRTVPFLIMSNRSTIDWQDKHCAVSPRCSSS
jgi:hypothetical protein